MAPVKERLRQIVLDSGLRQTTLGERAGRDKQWVYNRLKGMVDVAADDLPLFAKGLRRSPFDLCRELFAEEEAEFRSLSAPDRLATNWHRQLENVPEVDRPLVEAILNLIWHYRG